MRAPSASQTFSIRFLKTPAPRLHLTRRNKHQRGATILQLRRAKMYGCQNGLTAAQCAAQTIQCLETGANGDDGHSLKMAEFSIRALCYQYLALPRTTAFKL